MTDTSDRPKITVAGLTTLELRELEATAEDGAVQLLPSPKAATFSEPVSLVLASVVVSSVAINALALIALRPKKKSDRTFEFSREVNGEKLVVKISASDFSSGSPKKEIVDAICKGLALNPEIFSSLLGK